MMRDDALLTNGKWQLPPSARGVLFSPQSKLPPPARKLRTSPRTKGRRHG